jgi:hypothetical protein
MQIKNRRVGLLGIVTFRKKQTVAQRLIRGVGVDARQEFISISRHSSATEEQQADARHQRPYLMME